MTPHQALALAVRLFAVWYALVITREFVAFFASWRPQDDPQTVALVIGASVFSALILAVLWFFPRSIARGLLPLSSDAPAQPSSQEAWFTLGTTLLGLWIVASAIPAILRNLTVMYLFQSERMDMSGLRSGLLYYGIELLIGLCLVFGAAGIRRFIWWARNVGSG
jgi:hypothetical protein